MEAIKVKELKEIADEAKILYAQHLISREECRNQVMPFVNAYNEFSKQTAKKYNVPSKLINFQSYIR